MSEGRPKSATYAIRILWFSFVMKLFTSGAFFYFSIWKMDTLKLSTHESTGAIWAFILAVLFYAAFSGSLIFFVGHGINWARWLVMFLTVLRLPSDLSQISKMLLNHPFFAIQLLLFGLTHLIGIALLFRSPTSDWFRNSKIKWI